MIDLFPGLRRHLLLHPSGVELQKHREALSELGLDRLRPAQAAELPVHHDAETVAQGLAFVHTL